MKRLFSFTIIGLGAVALAAPAFAHHSFAMFDAQKSLVIDGTVSDLELTNPHSWLEIDSLAPDHTVKHWSLEMNNFVGLRRGGWRPKTLQKGDKVKVTIHPMRDGSSAGQLLTVLTADGRTLYGNGGPPAPHEGG